MGLRDLFDSDKRSKTELREEIRQRDDQLASFQLRLAALERPELDGTDSAAAPQPSQQALVERAPQLTQELARPRAESKGQTRTIENLGEEAQELRSAIDKADESRLALEFRIEEQGQTIKALTRKVSELKGRVDTERKRSRAILEARKNERRCSREESAKRHEAYLELLLQVEDLSLEAEALREERDQALEQVKLERESAPAITAAQLLKQLSDAQSELKQLERTHADTASVLEARADSAENRFRLKDFDYRNLRIRLTEAETINAAFKEEIQRIKRDTVPVAIHRAQCATLQDEVHSEKVRADRYRDETRHLGLELGKCREQVDQLKLDLAKTKAAKPDATFMNQAVLTWLVQDGDPEAAGVVNGWLGGIGEGPWPDALFREVLEGVDYSFWETPDADLRHLVVGRRGWTEELLLDQIYATDGESLRIYSQEMFLAKLMTGRDPFDSNDQALLMAFAQGHPALEFLMSLPAPWPAVGGHEAGDIEEVDPEDYGVSETPLHKLGYRVGATSALTESQRRRLLTECFEAAELEFTPHTSEEYIRKWGRRRSAQRLYRIAAHLKWLADSLGRDPRRPQAGQDWVNDLLWLRKTYYAPFGSRFAWP